MSKRVRNWQLWSSIYLELKHLWTNKKRFILWSVLDHFHSSNIDKSQFVSDIGGTAGLIFGLNLLIVVQKVLAMVIWCSKLRSKLCWMWNYCTPNKSQSTFLDLFFAVLYHAVLYSYTMDVLPCSFEFNYDLSASKLLTLAESNLLSHFGDLFNAERSLILKLGLAYLTQAIQYWYAEKCWKCGNERKINHGIKRLLPSNWVCYWYLDETKYYVWVKL